MIRKYSDALEVTEEALLKEGVFNAFVDIDARFHIDPHLLETTKIPELAPAHQRVKDYFEDVLRLLKASKRTGDVFFKSAWKRLLFPEFPYVSLGYGNRSGGNGIGDKLAFSMAETAVQIIEAGIDDPVIFELVGLIEEGIGADRISDMVAQIIAEDLLAFSERVAKNLQLKTTLKEHNGRLFEIPFDPVKKKPLILVPYEILRPLPIALSWDDIDSVCAYNQRLREALNEVIGATWRAALKKMKKHELRELLLNQPEMLRELVRQYKEQPPEPYDFSRDPDGIMIWYELAQEWAEKYPLLLENVTVVTPEQIYGVVKRICKQYGRLLERLGLNLLLFNDEGNLRKERFARLLFFGLAETYCRANNLDLSLIKQGGREIVLFKVSRGYRAKLFVSVKYSSNPHLCKQYEEAIEKYRLAQDKEDVIFLVVRTATSTQTLDTLRDLQKEATQNGQSVPELMVIDGRITDRTLDRLWELGSDDEWLKQKRNEPLESSMEENDFGESSNDTKTLNSDKEIVLQKRKPGRRPDPENDIAFEMIIEGKQTQKAWLKAFDYWCEEKGIYNPGSRDRDAFKKAMKRAEKRYNKQTK